MNLNKEENSDILASILKVFSYYCQITEID